MLVVVLTDIGDIIAPNWRTNYRNNKGSKVGLSMVDFRIYEHGLEGIPFLSAVTMENRST
ncbi:MAG: hypothetical protein WBP64_17375 [Nitrososphaeraceae archaeon]